MAKKLCLGCMKTYDGQFNICPNCGCTDNAGAKERFHLKPGTALHGKYKIGLALEKGLSNVSYAGLNVEKNERVVIKEYYPSKLVKRDGSKDKNVSLKDEGKTEFFMQGITEFVVQAEKLKSIGTTSGIATVKDVFTENNTAYMVMEYVDGKSLKEILDENIKLEPLKALDMTMHLLSALIPIHDAGIIHKGLKPENIIIDTQKKLKVIGFNGYNNNGKYENDSAIRVTSSGYDSPEVQRKSDNIGKQADVYSCAALLYKMLTGRTPTETQKEGNKVVKPSELGINLNKNTEKALMNALNENATVRIQTLEQFEKELGSADETVLNNKASIPLWAKIAIGIVAALILVFIIIAITGSTKKKDSKNESTEGTVADATVADAAEMVSIPDIVGKSLDEAKTILKDCGLNIDISGMRESEEKKYTILEQNPGSGFSLQKGDSVSVIISSGMEESNIYMPDIIGQGYDEAVAVLKEAGISDDRIVVEETEAPGIAKGCVVSCSKGADVKVESDEKIIIYVSKGIEEKDEVVTVPNFIGMNYEEAVQLAGSNGLSLKASKKEYNSKIKKDEIYEQSVAADETVSYGSTIEVSVSLGEKTVHVPDLSYYSKKNAEKKLKELGLKAKFEEDYSDTVSKGLVMKQNVTPESEVPDGSEIIVWISKGKENSTAKPTQKTTNTPTPEATVTTAPTQKVTGKPTPITNTPVPTEKATPGNATKR